MASPLGPAVVAGQVLVEIQFQRGPFGVRVGIELAETAHHVAVAKVHRRAADGDREVPLEHLHAQAHGVGLGREVVHAKRKHAIPGTARRQFLGDDQLQALLANRRIADDLEAAVLQRAGLLLGGPVPVHGGWSPLALSNGLEIPHDLEDLPLDRPRRRGPGPDAPSRQRNGNDSKSAGHSQEPRTSEREHGADP